MNIKFIILFILISLFNINLLAHSGKTDSKGGHYDHQNGGYHYHNDSNNIGLYFLIILFIILGVIVYFMFKVDSKVNNKVNSSQKKHNEIFLNNINRREFNKTFKFAIFKITLLVVVFITMMLVTINISGGAGFIFFLLFVFIISFFNDN